MNVICKRMGSNISYEIDERLNKYSDVDENGREFDYDHVRFGYAYKIIGGGA